MPFNKREYKSYKAFMDKQLAKGFYLNPEVYTSLKERDSLVRIDIALQILSDVIHSENYEAAQAVADAIRDWFKSIGYPLPEDAIFKLGEPNLKPIHCHISYVRCKKSGL